MQFKKAPRGATPLAQRPRVSHRHLLAVAALTAAVAIAALVAPGGDVEANRSADAELPGAMDAAIEVAESGVDTAAIEEPAPTETEDTTHSP